MRRPPALSTSGSVWATACLWYKIVVIAIPDLILTIPDYWDNHLHPWHANPFRPLSAAAHVSKGFIRVVGAVSSRQPAIATCWGRVLKNSFYTMNFLNSL